MSDSPEYSMSQEESELKQSQRKRPHSIFSKIYGLFRNKTLYLLDDKGKRKTTKNYDSSKNRFDKLNGISANKVTKPSKLKKRKFTPKRLNNEKDINVNVDQERFNFAIEPPVLESLKLSNIGPLESTRNSTLHRVTYEGRRDKRPLVIQLGPRKAIRINPNSSTSTISLSPPPVSIPPPVVAVSPPPESPPPVSIPPPESPPSTISLSPPAVSVSSPAITFSPPTVTALPSAVPISPPLIESRLLFYATNDRISPAQHIPTSNTSTPFRSRSRMIRVNTMEDLDEPQDNSKRSSVQENFNEVLEPSSMKENRIKKKKSKAGQKRKKWREVLRSEDNKVFRLAESNGKAGLTHAEGNGIKSAPEATRSSNINKIHNPFHITTGTGENTAPNRKDPQEYIANISGNFPKDNRDPYNFSSNSRHGFVPDKVSNTTNTADSIFHKSLLGKHDINLGSPNAVLKETGEVSKLFMNSDIDSEEDRVILEYRSKSRQYSELKWPGHDSIGDIILPSEPETPAKGKGKSKVMDGSKDANSSNKPRLLSDIMAERYKMDGFSFLGSFKTPHIPSNADNKSNDDLDSITEDKRESPVYKKFGIDIRKEIFREEERVDEQ